MAYVHENYDKISALVDYICPGLKLVHNVKLGKKSETNGDKRRSYHSEYVYTTRAYSNVSRVASMKLDFKSDLTIEPSVKKKGEPSVNIWLSGRYLAAFKRALKRVYGWFYDYSLGTFLNVDGRLTLNNSKDYTIQIEMYRQIIVFKPVVFERDDGSRYEAFDMKIIDERTATTPSHLFSIDEFDLLYDTLDKFDLYANGLALINYLGRPDFGSHMYDMDTYRNSIEGEEDSGEVSGTGQTAFTAKLNKNQFEKPKLMVM